MKFRITQRGSTAHIILVITLILAILGILGFVLWQSVSRQNEASQADSRTVANDGVGQNNDTSNTEGALSDTTLNQSNSITAGGYTMSVQYPSGWTDVQNPTFEATRDITSPDGKTTVSYGVQALAQYGGTCGGNVAIERLDWSTVSGLKGAKFASVIARDTETNVGYYSFGMVPSGAGVESMKAGDIVCAGTFSTPIFVKNEPLVIASAYVRFEDLEKDKEFTKEQAQKVFDSTEAQLARLIVESIAVK